MVFLCACWSAGLLSLITHLLWPHCPVCSSTRTVSSAWPVAAPPSGTSSSAPFFQRHPHSHEAALDMPALCTRSTCVISIRVCALLHAHGLAP